MRSRDLLKSAYTPGQSVLAPPRIERQLSSAVRRGASTLNPCVKGTLMFLTLALFGVPAVASAETIAGSTLALRSNGEARGDAWHLAGNGFVGTYAHLDRADALRVTVDCIADEKPAHVNVVLGDATVGDDVPAGATRTLTPTFDLPAGTHFVRIESTNGAGVTIARVAIDGADVLNEASDANALAAADTYIETGRRSAVTVKLDGVAPGTRVHVAQRRLAFQLGGNASGAKNVLLAPDAPADGDPAKFQRFVVEHFNALVPSNAGKWINTEPERGMLTMDYVDAVIAFARGHRMYVRMHNLIWDTEQQPQWARDLLDAAARGDADAKAKLRAAISDRIRYYVRDRAAGYDEVDVLNESVHKHRYVDVFGIDGVASIYKEAADACRAAGGRARTFVNEYNLLQYSQRPPYKGDGPANAGSASDPYDNWYREHVEALNAAGAEIGGIGVQYYADPRPNVRDPHSAARIFGALQNLSIANVPITLTEFGIKTGAEVATNERIMDETLRLVFGTPRGNGFLFFGFWKKAMWEQAAGAVLVDADWTLTPLGKHFDEMTKRWHTELDATVAADGTIRFVGFHGDYELQVDGEVTARSMTIVRGTTTYVAPRN